MKVFFVNLKNTRPAFSSVINFFEGINESHELKLEICQSNASGLQFMSPSTDLGKYVN